MRINLFAATTSAVAAGLLVPRERALDAQRRAGALARRLVATAGALVGRTAFTVWNQSVVNEKVYTLSLLSIALVLWLIVRWDDQAAGSGARSLSAADHLSARPDLDQPHDGRARRSVPFVLLFPPLLNRRAPYRGRPATEWSQWSRFLLRARALALAGMESDGLIIAAAVAYRGAHLAALTGNWRFTLTCWVWSSVGLSVYIYLPIRAGHFPPINEGEPTNGTRCWTCSRASSTASRRSSPIAPGADPSLVAQLVQLLAVLQLAVRARLAGARPAGPGGGVRLPGHAGARRHWKADPRTALAMTV